MSDYQMNVLKTQLWNVANTLRGKMSADDYRDYILGFIFYKYLSEKLENYANTILQPDGITYLEIDENTETGQEYLEAVRVEAVETLGYFLKPSELFSQVSKRGNDRDDETSSSFILEDLDRILNNIQLSTMGTDSEEDFDNLFEDIDLSSSKLGKTAEQRNVLIARVLHHLNEIDFQLEQSERDVLGDAYEYLIGEFAAGAGKKAGEFYTPQPVSKLLAKLVTTGKTKLKSVYDPTCGSGSLLLRVAKEVQEVGHFYGQEMNRTTYNLARMNMILHDVHYSRFDIKNDDTLEHPQHEGMQFEAVVANPPFSAQWSANPLFTTDERFGSYGKLAPSSKADFAFVQHMVHHLADNGTMAVVLPHGVLFRGGAELLIRRYLVENRNYLDAVIGLPANIFYGTSIPTCILIFKKCRETPEDVLFIDASHDFEKVKTQNYLRDEDLHKIVTTYRERTELPKYSVRVPLATIVENEYNLNIPRYVDTFESEETIDLNAIAEELQTLEQQLTETNTKIAGYCQELGIVSPF
ncbi:type I restriction-modification system subunit M [Siphonobacter sp. BAB-5385]|uniref:type I restriction-modification system subunit M n=1 Tax=Siphonobacter sp. BAB-5385 TaxID=1864822 RepID=UPI000B9DF964|nr:type I restriction-modification system subunit M [Siphonobacter sp. BAB-5385]OZI05713.1 type I restriction-modification system subunit M [Siphonobacter sp. BAB-5385]